jgi:hypothetical protein
MFDQFRREVATLLEVVTKRATIEADTADKGWSIVDSVVLFQGRVFMSSSSSHWAQVLEQAHDIGHEGVQKTLQHLWASFYTPHDNRLVREFIKGCLIYQRHKTEHLHSAGLLQPLDVPSSIWCDIAMDFVEGFPRVGGKSLILTVVDRLSKYVHFISLGHPYSTISVAKAFFEQVVCLHGMSASIVSDHDPVFTSMIWWELFRLSDTQLRTSSAFHPQTDGQSEVMNRIITIYLRCLAGDRPKSWLRWLSWAEYCYNTSYQTTLHATPFEVVYGRALPTMAAPFQARATRVVAVERRDRDVFLEEIRSRLVQAQSMMKLKHDKHHRALELAVGDWA